MSMDPALLWAVAAALVAGVTRGFSGFGGALIFVPLVSAAFSPAVAVPTLLAIDTLMTLPMVARAFRECVWREVAPLAIGAVVAVPFGVFVLKHIDPILLRWALAALALCLLVLLGSGWRHQGGHPVAAMLGLGLVAGTLGGAAQMSGPPVVAYWLGGGQSAMRVRANLFGFFALVTLATGTAYALNGLFTLEVGRLSLILGPLYAIGLIVGSRAFKGASDAYYRKAAYLVIALAALFSMPLFDAVLRP